MTFDELRLVPSILKALKQEHYETPTPIQEKAIPAALEGRDVLGCAQTGTGKTAAFSLPIIQRLSEQPVSAGPFRPIRSLILTPTRELAIQIYDNIQAYARFTRIRSVVIVGGVSQKPQEQALKNGTDILIATPGRLLDLLNQKLIDLKQLKILVLDEADRMLDMGFIHDVKRIIAQLPPKRQTLFFSATMPTEIANLVKTLLVNPVKIEVHPVSSTVERIEQRLYKVDKENKPKLLKLLLQDPAIESALVFTRTKHGADKVVKDLTRAGIPAQAIHGNKSQNARQAALGNFKSGTTRVLVATDIAARGIDIEELSHVVNYNLPNIPETYVHRIGRTGRAGLSGVAISFCETEELPYLKDIQKLTGKTIPEVKEHPYPLGSAPSSVEPEPAPQARGGRGGSRSGAAAADRQASAKPQRRREETAGETARRPQANGQPGGRKPQAAPSPRQEQGRSAATPAPARSGRGTQPSPARAGGADKPQPRSNGRTAAPARPAAPASSARIWPDPKPAGTRPDGGRQR
ncbi:DEAD/DEAH box helicase [Gorillibacterium sp. sgz500922]|uniref:DEAD/DEAH box helicase n=1 Tax=Gorillibacterium sp. sgz500922 TaxID=3446694 RepID=UPI003F66CA6E